MRTHREIYLHLIRMSVQHTVYSKIHPVYPSKNHVAIHPLSIYLSIYLSIDTATRPRGHSRQISAASDSIRQKKIRLKEEVLKHDSEDKNR